MSILTKIFVVIITVAAIVASVVFIQHANTQENWRQIADSRQRAAQLAQANLAEAQVSLDRVQTEFAQYRQDAAEIQSNLRSDLQGVRSDLISSEQRNAQLQSTGGVNAATLSALESQLAGQQSLVQEVQGQLDQCRQENINLQQQIRQMSATLQEAQVESEQLRLMAQRLREDVAEKDEQIANLRTQLASAGTTADGQAGPRPMTPEVFATVQDVEDGLAAINVGSADGVAPGMEFTVYRGSQYVATLVIEEVDADTAGGRLIEQATAAQIGDKAATQLAPLGGM